MQVIIMVKRSNRLLAYIRKIVSVIVAVQIVLSLSSCAKDNSGFDGTRFSDTRHITVLVDYFTGKQTEKNVNTCQAARFVHDAVLRDCNIEVTFIESSKYTLQYGVTADVSYSGDYDSFIRSDWLEKLGLDVPQTKDELYSCLTAFRDNADILLGDESGQIIPFFIDNEPNVSAKPLFDSYLDTDISDKDFYVNGYCRVTQNGYREGLETLNRWYREDLLPDDFENIRPLTKESYEPIEKGYVGAFCAKCDYLYANGSNSHISALKDNIGEEAGYIAVNCFENSKGEYTSWQEDYLNEGGTKIFLPSTCKDPLASMVYLNWISDPDNISAIRDLDINDEFSSDRYLLTYKGYNFSGQYPEAEQARQTADEVNFIQRNNKCIRYKPYYFKFVKGDIDYSSIYPDSTRDFVCKVIGYEGSSFDEYFTKEFDEYGTKGSYVIYYIRNEQWEKVMVKGDMSPW